MRCADLLLPLYLVLSLGSLSACDDPFLVTACKFTMDPEICGKDKLPDMGMPEDGTGSTADLASAPPPVMKLPVSFTMVQSSPLSTMHKWVGMRPNNIILFANQNGNSDAMIDPYSLKESTSTPLGWDLISIQCPNCPKLINNVDQAEDYLLTSNSIIFLIRPYWAYLTQNGKYTPSDHINQTELVGNVNAYRPFVSPAADIIIFQRKTNLGDISQVNFYPMSAQMNIKSFADRISDVKNPINTTYYAIGQMDGPSSELFKNPILVFENNRLNGAYRLNNQGNYVNDDMLSDEIRDSIIKSGSNSILCGSTGNQHSCYIRGAFFSDLNNDGFIELIYARGPKIYVTSYDPRAIVGSRFNNWPEPILSIDTTDVILTLTASDLDGDEFPELAIEVNKPHAVQFYLNKK